VEIASVLIAHGADVNERGGPYNTSPLLAAVTQGNVKMVQVLLSHHADPNLADVNSRRPLLEAKDLGYTDLVEILRMAGGK